MTTTPAQAFSAAKPLGIKSVNLPLPEAWEQAKAELEPIFVPAAVFADDRGWSIMNQMLGVLTTQGQINYSVMYPGVIKAWHRHQKQTDFWMGLHGHLKVGVHRETDGKTWLGVIGEKKPGVLMIPPPLWHGAATISHEPAGLLYYVTHAYDPKAPDEDRRAFDSITGFPWAVRHG
jgi:dTDP-4-dehydrorhamnose 3,5-epimerase